MQTKLVEEFMVTSARNRVCNLSDNYRYTLRNFRQNSETGWKITVICFTLLFCKVLNPLPSDCWATRQRVIKSDYALYMPAIVTASIPLSIFPEEYWMTISVSCFWKHRLLYTTPILTHQFSKTYSQSSWLKTRFLLFSPLYDTLQN